MSVYRQARPGRPALVIAIAIAFLLAGVVGGALLFDGSDDDRASLRDAVDELRDDMRPAVESLDVLAIEYGQAVRGGRVVAPTEYEGAKGHLERARVAFDRARDDLVLLAPAETAVLERRLDELEQLVDRRAPAARVEAKARETAAAIRRALREPAG
jgi:hypothetical protein